MECIVKNSKNQSYSCSYDCDGKKSDSITTTVNARYTEVKIISYYEGKIDSKEITRRYTNGKIEEFCYDYSEGGDKTKTVTYLDGKTENFELRNGTWHKV